MNAVILPLLALAAIAAPPHPARSARPAATVAPASTGFDRERSAALFVGVRKFVGSDIADVPYAVDDAIDLAYMFAIDQHVRLVAPKHVVLALSGQPQKPKSQQRLQELLQAGAQVRMATDVAILSLVTKQAAFAGRDGLFILSFATHGFFRDGSQSIVGSNSKSLSMATVGDSIAEHDVRHSLILIDACKVRIRGPGRGVDPGAYAATQLSHHMRRVRGEVMLSAVGAAYDDPVRCNGVFTAAVIDGLHCNATAPRGQVTADTLAAYVERRVRDWIIRNRNHDVDSAVQISIELEAKKMPLAQCRPQSCSPMIVATEGSIVRALSTDRKQTLWQSDAGGRITHAESSGKEVVAGTHDALIAFNCDGTRRWRISDGKPLRAFVTADLFRNRNSEVIALWGSRVAIYSPLGEYLSAYDHTHPLQHLAICRPTSRHAPRIVVTSANNVLLFDPKKLDQGRPLWSGHITRSETIESVKIIDYDHDTKTDIAITTSSGATLFLDFKGKMIGRNGTADFRLDRRKRHARK